MNAAIDRRRCLLLALAAAAPTMALAASAPPEVAAYWPAAQRIGQARLRLMGLLIYDARLWSPGRPRPDDWWQTPFALELQYARGFSGARIAERSLTEMRRQTTISDEQAARWLRELGAAFPDVAADDRLTGVHEPAGTARFHFNGKPGASWTDAQLTRTFFGIWLRDGSSEPALREALFGGRG